MPQNGPRRAPERAWRSDTMSAAARVAAMVSPGSASISAPSKRIWTGAPAGRMSGCFRRMANGLHWWARGTHEEISRHLYGPDHAFYGRRQESRRGGAETAGRFPDRGG